MHRAWKLFSKPQWFHRYQWVVFKLCRNCGKSNSEPSLVQNGHCQVMHDVPFRLGNEHPLFFHIISGHWSLWQDGSGSLATGESQKLRLVFSWKTITHEIEESIKRAFQIHKNYTMIWGNIYHLQQCRKRVVHMLEIHLGYFTGPYLIVTLSRLT